MDTFKSSHANQARGTAHKRQERSSPYTLRPRSGWSSKTSRMTSPAKSGRLLTQQPFADGTPATKLPGSKKTQSLSAVSNETRAVARQKSKPTCSITEPAKKTTAGQAEEARSSDKFPYKLELMDMSADLYICRHCCKEYSYSYEVEEHLEDEHDGVELDDEDVWCQTCPDAGFTSVFELKEHLKTHVMPSANRWCEPCGRSFAPSGQHNKTKKHKAMVSAHRLNIRTKTIRCLLVPLRQIESH